jgi:hypothetical protein
MTAAAVLGLASALLLLGAGQITTYFGLVRAVDAHSITFFQRNSAEKTLPVAAGLKAMASGKPVPLTSVKPNSRVQLAVDEQGTCVRVVVEEVPR